MSLHEVECSQRIAKVRIHDVERVIGLLKNKYTILQSTLSISLLKCKNNTEHAFIDKLLTLCVLPLLIFLLALFRIKVYSYIYLNYYNHFAIT